MTDKIAEFINERVDQIEKDTGFDVVTANASARCYACHEEFDVDIEEVYMYIDEHITECDGLLTDLDNVTPEFTLKYDIGVRNTDVCKELKCKITVGPTDEA